MEIVKKVYEIISSDSDITALVGQNIYPTAPTENTQLPVIIYNISSVEQQVTTTGLAGLNSYTLELDIWAVNLDDCLAIAKQCKDSLDLYRGTVFQGIFFKTNTLTIEEEGFHESQSYTVWATV